jgi:hypothetical protein
MARPRRVERITLWSRRLASGAQAESPDSVKPVQPRGQTTAPMAKAGLGHSVQAVVEAIGAETAAAGDGQVPEVLAEKRLSAVAQQKLANTHGRGGRHRRGGQRVGGTQVEGGRRNGLHLNPRAQRAATRPGLKAAQPARRCRSADTKGRHKERRRPMLSDRLPLSLANCTFRSLGATRSPTCTAFPAPEIGPGCVR